MFDPNRKLNPVQKVLTASQYKKLVKNHNQKLQDGAEATKPVVKFFGGAATWLLTELDPETGDAYGLCDLGMGYPELGYVSLVEICERKGFPWIERDLHFKPTKTLVEYQDLANDKGLVGC